MRFHFLGLAHIPTRSDITVCAYTQKIVKLCRMLRGLGHEVMFYGVESSDVECNERVDVMSLARSVELFGNADWVQHFFNIENPSGWREFGLAAAEAVNARKRDGDILLCPWGVEHKIVADLTGLPAVEPGIGYEGVFAQFRVFESYAWMHYLYGRRNEVNGSWYDAVIPNYFDVLEFPFRKDKMNYLLYIGRLVQRKGVQVALDVARRLGMRLVVAGQGGLVNESEGLDLRDPLVEYVGVVGAVDRGELMSRARAVLVPTYYIEPFGSVAVEAQLCGTPVITTDWGAFSETVLHGVTGYRCRTLSDFVAAAEHAGDLDPDAIRRWARQNYSMERVAAMYDEYFSRLGELWGDGWYTVHHTPPSDWLMKRWPQRCTS